MNSHVQLDETGNFLRYIPSSIPILWDENNYCTASALEKDGKADQFKVYPLYTSAVPEFNELTHKVEQTDAVLINGQWTEQWKVTALTPEEASAKMGEWRGGMRCHRRQGELALLQAGKLDAVDAAIASIADPIEKRRAQIEYGADVWERTNPFLQQMWAALGGTPEELDDLFRLAVTL